MDKPPYKPPKETTSLATYSEDDNSLCLPNLILKLNQDLQDDGAEKHNETVTSSSTIHLQIGNIINFELSILSKGVEQYIEDIFDSRLFISSMGVKQYLEASSSITEHQIRHIFDSRLLISSLVVENYIEASSSITQQQIEDLFDSRLCIWGRGVENHIDEEDETPRTIVHNFTSNYNNTSLTICVVWKGCKTSSREATPLGDPRGVPKFTYCDFQVFNSDFLDCTKFGQLSKDPTVLAYFESKVGSRKGFQLMVTSYDKSARLSLKRPGFQLSRLIKDLKEARSSLLQGWRFWRRLSAQLKSVTHFQSKWIVLTICSVMLLLVTKSNKIPLTNIETLRLSQCGPIVVPPKSLMPLSHPQFKNRKEKYPRMSASSLIRY